MGVNIARPTLVKTSHATNENDNEQFMPGQAAAQKVRMLSDISHDIRSTRHNERDEIGKFCSHLADQLRRMEDPGDRDDIIFFSRTNAQGCKRAMGLF